jgi:hypothetical protein
MNAVPLKAPGQLRVPSSDYWHDGTIHEGTIRSPMKTLKFFADGKFSIPATTAWYLESLGEFRGKQELLYTRQSPQKLSVLREHALIESAVSSNRIEGVSVEPSRIQSVLVAYPAAIPRPRRGGNPRLSRCSQMDTRKVRGNSHVD